VHLSFATEDVVGAIYYWKSTASSNGTGGQIWVKDFGSLAPEQQVTGVAGGALSASCNGCHVLSRDGQRMVLYSDDNDSDDEYGDVNGSLIDMATRMPIGTGFVGRGTGQPPGFSSLSPDHAYYVSSNGNGTMPTNDFSLWDGNNGNMLSTITFGTAGERPTMPDWSPDGKSVMYVLPQTVAAWRADDDHVFGGSLYTLPYNGNMQFGATPSVFLKSSGENNYYPSYSPDGQFVIFDRVPQDTSVSTLNGCVMTPHPLCPNDSFSNPVARLMMTTSTAGGPVVDLASANGSPASAPVPVSNSWARWSPFLQNYKGHQVLWVAFSSTRDYGVRVQNHLTGMYQCYPSDSAANPGTAHHGLFDPLCVQPQLWMAAIQLGTGGDPSRVAFWLPFQDIRTHNHTPQWAQAVVGPNNPPPPPPMSGTATSGTATSGTAVPPPDAGNCIPVGSSCTANPSGCCAGAICAATGLCAPYIIH
jgi:hypothetical protein